MGESRIIHETMSGVVVHITPINLPTLRAIQLRAEKVFPDPDPTPFQHPEENAFDPSQMTRAEDDPQYMELLNKTKSDRARWVDKAIFTYCATFPDYPTSKSLIDRYYGDLTVLRSFAELPEDDYEAIVYHIVLNGNKVGVDQSGQLTPTSSDFSKIVQLAIQVIALTPDEVVEGIKFFRAKI